jgi:hypothetical protein
MRERIAVVLEIGPKGRRVVAAAYEWPGLERWGKDEDDAVAKLAAYVARYAIPEIRPPTSGASLMCRPRRSTRFSPMKASSAG